MGPTDHIRNSDVASMFILSSYMIDAGVAAVTFVFGEYSYLFIPIISANDSKMLAAGGCTQEREEYIHVCVHINIYTYTHTHICKCM